MPDEFDPDAVELFRDHPVQGHGSANGAVGDLAVFVQHRQRRELATEGELAPERGWRQLPLIGAPGPLFLQSREHPLG